MRIGDLNLDLETRRVSRAGRALDLPDLSFDLLAALADSAPETLSGPELARRVWGRRHVTEETLSQRVALLRRALGDDAKAPRYVRTVRGAGYRLAVRPGRARPVWRMAAAAGFAGALALFGAVTLLPQDAPPPALTGPALDAADLRREASAALSLHRPADNASAIALFERALGLEPDQREALVGLSFALSHRATKFGGGPEDSLRAQALAEQAARAEPDFAGARHARALALDAQGRVDEALADYRRAFALNPTDDAARSSAAYLLQARGELYEALKLEAEALRRGRPSLYAELQIGHSLSLLGFADAAAAWTDRALTLHGGAPVIRAGAAMAEYRAGHAAQAIRMLQADRASGQLSSSGAALLATALAGEGRLAEAGAVLNEAKEERGLLAVAIDGLAGRTAETSLARSAGEDTWPGARVAMAEAQAAHGHGEAALESLNAAVDLGWRDAALLRASPFFRSLEEAPEFEALLARIDRATQGQHALVALDPDLAFLFED